GALAAGRDAAAVLPGPVSPDYAGYVAMADPLAAAVGAVLATDDVLDKQDAKAIAAFYAARGDRPVWIADGTYTPAARAVMDRLANAAEDGLDPADYPLPWLELGAHFQSTPERIAHYDVLLSQSVARYARHAYSGRVTPTKVSANLDYAVKPLDAGDVLALVSASDDPVATLAAYNPPQPEFAALRAELARLRAAESAADALPVVPDGVVLKPGMSDPRVPVLRARLQLASATLDAELYDELLVAAVEDFQGAAGLRQDGIVGRNTLAALNGRQADPVTTVLVNMERWRWMPRYLGDFSVRVNVPEYTLYVYDGQDVAYTTRVVVGKVGSQTPIFSDEIRHVVVNPYWNVPASIVRNEMLPKIRSGSGLRGYQVYANVRGKFRAVDPRSVNWRKVDARKIQVRQPPGASNALGQVKFLFPNKHDVYLHDTPSKSLFERDVRAYSHGCVRVMNPWDFAEALLAKSDQISGAAIRKRVGGGESWVNLDRHIPVHITYFTAFVDAGGKLQVRDDIYGHDKRVAAALGLS
ncbi:MAG: L,D-transpeptidase family protein, partial [Rhizobiales bacterium]|nr:L,D-transpeptidase family protein [Hyphomicrobiales bacterium]